MHTVLVTTIIDARSVVPLSQCGKQIWRRVDEIRYCWCRIVFAANIPYGTRKMTAEQV